MRGSPFGGRPGALNSCVSGAPQKISSDPRDVVVGGRLRFQHAHHLLGGALTVEPDHGDVVFGCADAGWIGRRLRERQAPGIVRNRRRRGGDGVIRGVRDPQVARRINRALAVLGRDDDQRGVPESLALQFGNHLADGKIHELDFTEQSLRRRSLRVKIAAENFRAERLLDQLFSHADCLEVHSEDGGHWGRSRNRCASCHRFRSESR